ncbi:hypothetical protein NN561_017865 [Cricetulus griseus]
MCCGHRARAVILAHVGDVTPLTPREAVTNRQSNDLRIINGLRNMLQVLQQPVQQEAPGPVCLPSVPAGGMALLTSGHGCKRAGFANSPWGPQRCSSESAEQLKPQCLQRPTTEYERHMADKIENLILEKAENLKCQFLQSYSREYEEHLAVKKTKDEEVAQNAAFWEDTKNILQKPSEVFVKASSSWASGWWRRKSQ